MCDLAATGIDAGVALLVAFFALGVGIALISRSARRRSAVLALALLLAAATVVLSPSPAKAACPAPPVLTTLSISPASWSAGSTAGQQSFVVTNTGTAAATSVSASVTGDGAFTLLSTTCAATLAPAGSCSATVDFAPTGSGGAPLTAALQVSASNSSTVVAALDGVEPSVAVIAVTPAALTLAVGVPSAVVIINVSAVSAFNISAVAVPDLTFDTSACTALPAAGSCMIGVVATAALPSTPILISGDNTNTVLVVASAS